MGIKLIGSMLDSAPRSVSQDRILRWVAISLIVCLSITVVAWGATAYAKWSAIDKISAVSFSEVAAHTVKLAPGAREEYLVLPNSSVDARWWVLHTKKMLRDGTLRVRNTALDNAPDGREVHWSSILMWVLAILAWFRSWGTGQPAEWFVADAAVAAGPLLLVLFFGALWWVARRAFGWLPAIFYLLVLLTTQGVVRTFDLGEADHHGIVLAFASACALCLVAGGAGFARRTDPIAPRWFVASGLTGAAALWVSASTALPILAGLGAGGLLAGWFFARNKKPAPLRPDLWVVWGLAGCLGSLAFYLLEYFPRHMSWRLEVNHPLYAFAWLGGAWLLCRILEGRLAAKFPFREIGDWVKAALCVLMVAAPVAAIILAGDHVFWVSDSFLLALHKEYISEFQSIAGILRWKGQEQNALVWIILYFWIWVIFAGALALWISGKGDGLFRRTLSLLLPATMIMQMLSLWQVRWSSAAFALWALWGLLAVAAVCRLPVGSPWLTRGLAFVAAVPWIAFLLGPLPSAAFATKAERTCLDAPLSEDVGGNLLVRDVTHRLLQASPGQVPTVLTGPNTSTEMVYHGGVRVLGTLYWENMPGLKKAAEIFAASTEEATKRLLMECGVTHIVVPSWSNFGEAYAGLLAKAQGKESPDSSYLDAVLKSEEFPVWLRPFAYPIPTATGIDAQSVRVVALIPAQNEFEAHYYRGVYHFESGQPDKARAQFELALNLRPGEPRVQAYLRQLAAAP
jgi:hypothetical protein